jgi:hypothetical protein
MVYVLITMKCCHFLHYILMNLEYPLNDSYFAFKHIQIIKCKEHVVLLSLRRSSSSVGIPQKQSTMLW